MDDQIRIFKIQTLTDCLETIKRKCIEPTIDNSNDFESNNELVTYYKFILASFKTLEILQNILTDPIK